MVLFVKADEQALHEVAGSALQPSKTPKLCSRILGDEIVEHFELSAILPQVTFCYQDNIDVFRQKSYLFFSLQRAGTHRELQDRQMKVAARIGSGSRRAKELERTMLPSS